MITGERLSETGQWLESAEGTRWWFDSGALCLDFAYTGSMGAVHGEPGHGWEQLINTADLDDWLADRFTVTAASEGDLRDALTLRDAVSHLALAIAHGHSLQRRDIDVVNLYAATPDLPPRLDGGSRRAGRTTARASQALSTIARDAVAVFSGARSGSIRECDADDCNLVYLDTSRAGTRRWCSMQRCGNRHKVRQHRARQRARSGSAQSTVSHSAVGQADA